MARKGCNVGAVGGPAAVVDRVTARSAYPSPRSSRGDVALQATGAMIQYHGGIGYTWEHGAHFFYKRAKRLAGQWGDADTHRAKIADLTIPPVVE
jgi:hypothetical protein